MERLIDRYARVQFKIKDGIIYIDRTIFRISLDIRDVFALKDFSFYNWLVKEIGEKESEYMCINYGNIDFLHYYRNGMKIDKSEYDARIN